MLQTRIAVVSVWSKACIKEGIKSSGIHTLLNVGGKREEHHVGQNKAN